MKSKLNLRLPSFLLVLAFFIFIGLPHIHAQNWTRARPISSFQRTCLNPQVGMNREGIASSTYESSSGEIFLASQRTSGRWSVRQLQVLNEGLSAGRNPQIAVNGRGDIGIAWVDSNQFVTAWFKANSSSVPDTQVISSASQISGSPKIGIDSSGDIYIAWLEATSIINQERRLQVATRRISGVWEFDSFFPVDLDKGFDLAVNNNDHAAVVWISNNNVFGATNFSNQDWLQAQISTGGNNFHPKLAVATDGDATAIWVEQSNNKHHIYISSKQAGGPNPWSPPFIIATTNTDPTAVVASADSVSTYVVWEENKNIESWQIKGSLTPFSSSIVYSTISDSGKSFGPRISMDPELGGTTVVWQEFDHRRQYQVFTALKRTPTLEDPLHWTLPVRLGSRSVTSALPQVIDRFIGSTEENGSTVVWQKDSRFNLFNDITIFSSHLGERRSLQVRFRFR